MSTQTSWPSVPVEDLASEPYIGVLCYPSPDRGEAERRIGELKRLQVSRFIFEGHIQMGRLHLLGKGCVSIVVKAEGPQGVCALKIRRLDANRPSMSREVELHRVANSLQVGPKLYIASDNFILMELVKGESVIKWIKGLKGRGSTGRLRAALREIMDQCFRLDQAGLDHGQLSNPEKHLYIGEKVVMIDFETASIQRRVSNVTSAAQGLLIGGRAAGKVRKMLRTGGVESVIEALRGYKQKPGKEGFEEMLVRMKLTQPDRKYKIRHR